MRDEIRFLLSFATNPKQTYFANNLGMQAVAIETLAETRRYRPS
jgi:hypothetical protein